MLSYNYMLSYNSKAVWKPCRLYFSNKSSNAQENITLLEKDNLLSKQKDVAAIFNKNFRSVTDWLNFFSCPEDTSMSLLKKLPFTDV